MKRNDFQIAAYNPFAAVVQFLRKELGCVPSEPLHLYINASFAPSPDETLGNLFRAYSTQDHLIVNYSTTPAWG
ncbi:Ubiquitin-like protein [Malassezia japonica]|uniref:Ubiquitin-like protein ATG12 n=1 Tax=Malassezia japonica TaxID=223818 RepID=A0AAF0EYN7_9BASI|nr:Ubiquitin-like protein [Malassezia japonica]WFD37505.1 Ubiquitin-like protein [Malassezia japonica]